eukprot:scaffold8173_cov66-Phaeocystis_antarctica.AAC.3
MGGLGYPWPRPAPPPLPPPPGAPLRRRDPLRSPGSQPRACPADKMLRATARRHGWRRLQLSYLKCAS